MGAKEILAYRQRERMTVRQFLEFWLDEFPRDELHDAALVLAEIVAADRACIQIGETDPSLDVWDEDRYAHRRDLQEGLVAALRKMAVDRSGIEHVPEVLLSRDALAEASEAVRIPAARFLLPPRFSAPTVDTRPSSEIQRRNGTASDCYYSENFRTVFWFGETYVFSPQQARAVEQLWLAWQKGIGLSQKEIGELIESRSDNFRLRDLFRVSKKPERMHRAWNTMIKEAGKGVYELRAPPEA